VNTNVSLAFYLRNATIHSVRGVPMGTVPNVFLHIILSSNDGTIVITGQAADVVNRTEAFFLTEEVFDPSQWKTGLYDESAWQAIDLTSMWGKSPFAQIFGSPRAVRYYLDPRDRDRGLTPQGPLDSTAALELEDLSQDPTRRVVLYATPEYPCAVELVTTPERCQEVLANLQEFIPVSAEATFTSMRTS
jgi:hypothetical protein